MAIVTFGDVIDRVLVNVGDTRAGNEDAWTDILEDLTEFLDSEFPDVAGGQFVEGSFVLTLGGPTSDSDAKGVAAWPVGTRSLSGLFKIDNDVPLSERRIYRRPRLFFGAWPVVDPVQTGKPNSVLVFNREMTFRPAPDISSGATEFSTEVWGTTYEFTARTESTVVEFPEFIPILIAFGTVQHATRKGADEIAARWEGPLNSRLSGRRMARHATFNKATINARYL